MVAPIAAAGAAMLPGFFGGLGYGTGLQYSYARGFPAFEAGGAKGFTSVIKRDAQDMLATFMEGAGIGQADPISGVNKSGLTYSQWANQGIPKKTVQHGGQKKAAGAQPAGVSTYKNTLSKLEMELNRIGNGLKAARSRDPQVAAANKQTVIGARRKAYSSWQSDMKALERKIYETRSAFKKKYGYYI